LYLGATIFKQLMPDKEFWDSHYNAGQTGWDLGSVSPPLKAYIDQISDKSLRILIPGAGNSYEALHLLEQGFMDVTVLDIAPTVIRRLTEKTKNLSRGRLHAIEEDFFRHTGKYDLILEQTFFCALEPERREEYARHMHELLGDGGKLTGILFNTVFEFGPPPFGGYAGDYKKLFAPYFNFRTWAACYNSYPARAGSEWFMILEKK
jgi:SAM-dependent methyltransferase